jgi:potassium-transporting ATPase KdpC subunit
VDQIGKELKTAVLVFAAFSLLTGIAYPLFITGVVQLTMPQKASGSLVFNDGEVIGSELIGQAFINPGYFHGRPSAVNYSANSSGASNYGPTNARLMTLVSQRIEQIRAENELSPNESVPADLVLASGSGLDPHISVAGAMLQVTRIAKARRLPPSEVKVLIYQHIEPALFGILGQERINVLKLNLALDNLTG